MAASPSRHRNVDGAAARYRSTAHLLTRSPATRALPCRLESVDRSTLRAQLVAAQILVRAGNEALHQAYRDRVYATGVDAGPQSGRDTRQRPVFSWPTLVASDEAMTQVLRVICKSHHTDAQIRSVSAAILDLPPMAPRRRPPPAPAHSPTTPAAPRPRNEAPPAEAQRGEPDQPQPTAMKEPVPVVAEKSVEVVEEEESADQEQTEKAGRCAAATCRFEDPDNYPPSWAPAAEADGLDLWLHTATVAPARAIAASTRSASASKRSPPASGSVSSA